MDFQATHCCGIQEITQLSQHENAEEAMENFCRSVFGNTRKVSYRGLQAKKSTMFSFYMFTAAVYSESQQKKHDDQYYRPYGAEFAAFIKTHKLGSVSTQRARTNYAFHPDHKVQAWIWRPNIKTLEAWWIIKDEQQQQKKAAQLELARERQAAYDVKIKAAAEAEQAAKRAATEPAKFDLVKDLVAKALDAHDAMLYSADSIYNGHKDLYVGNTNNNWIIATKGS